MQEKTTWCFSYMSLRITFKEAPTSNSLAPTRRRLQPPSFLRLQPKGSSNSPNLWLQPEEGYNPLCSPATTERWLQPPILAPSNRLEVEVE